MKIAFFSFHLMQSYLPWMVNINKPETAYNSYNGYIKGVSWQEQVISNKVKHSSNRKLMCCHDNASLLLKLTLLEFCFATIDNLTAKICVLAAFITVLLQCISYIRMKSMYLYVCYLPIHKNKGEIWFFILEKQRHLHNARFVQKAGSAAHLRVVAKILHEHINYEVWYIIIIFILIIIIIINMKV